MEAIMRPRLSRQRDLFKVSHKPADIPTTQKDILVSLLERLLVEALADDDAAHAAHAANDKTKEAAHEQDQA
jgi:hypothetical protein